MATDEQLQAIELFGELSAKERRAVRSLMTSVQVKAGKVLMEEGTPGREFLVIISGTATVRRGGRVLASVGPGDFLGELAVIAGVPRTATVIADTGMELSVLNRREFSSLLDENPRIARKILVGAVKRLHQIDTSLSA